MAASMGRKGRSRAKRGMIKAVVEQLGLVIIWPWDSGGCSRGPLFGEVGGVDERDDMWDVGIATEVFGFG